MTDLQLAEETFQAFVRGDAMIGLMADPAGAEAEMLDRFRAAAARGEPAAWSRLGDVLFAVLVPMGAYDGAWEPVLPDWPAEALAIEDDNPSLEGALRCTFQAARLGQPGATLRFAQRSRYASASVQRIALDLLDALPHPTGADRYQQGLVHHWLGDLDAARGQHEAAAALGHADAMFELALYLGQGLAGEVDPEGANAWLQRAADLEHPRALYNLGVAWATGQRGSVDMSRAAGFYRRAAERGHGRAAATLGVMILSGELTGSEAEARSWLDRADEVGYPSWEMLDVMGLADPRA